MECTEMNDYATTCCISKSCNGMQRAMIIASIVIMIIYLCANYYLIRNHFGVTRGQAFVLRDSKCA